jgi:S-adenosylmethionine decarboxylase
MKNIAPEVLRQRLLIEGHFAIEVNRETVTDFFRVITESLGLRTYGEPIIFSPGGEGKEANQGFDAFVPLIDSGISLYVWSNAKFFSIIVYTCKSFDAEVAVRTASDFFQAKDAVSMTF